MDRTIRAGGLTRTTLRLRALTLLLLSLTLSGCSSLIKWGWDEPDQAFLRTHVAAMERKPFDGVVLRLTVPGVPPHLSNFSWHIADHRYRWDDLRPAVDELKAVPFRRFTHNFLRINLNPTDRPFDLLDDEAWDTLFSNLKLAARIVSEGGLRGFMIDPEAYGPADPLDGSPRFNAFDYRRRAVQEASFQAYRSAAFRRGRQAAAILGNAAPDLVLLFAFAYSFPCRSPKPETERTYGLLPAFVDGILSTKPKEMTVVEGNELSYPFRYCHQFQEAYRRLRSECRRLSSVPEHYDQELEIGFGIWMDYESGEPCAPYHKEGRPCPWADPSLYPDQDRHLVDPQALERAVASALDLSDRYVWLYSHEPKWWTSSRPEGENLPIEFVQAVERARSAAVAQRGSICARPAPER